MKPKQKSRLFCGINCPTCGSTQGDPCVENVGGDMMSIATVHRARKEAARKRRFSRGVTT